MSSHVKQLGTTILLLVLAGCGDEEPRTAGSAGPPRPGQVSINELMPGNSRNTTIVDEYGEHDDWIELSNAGDKDASLDGYFITDDEKDPFKRSLPAQAVVPAKGFLILWADKTPGQGPLHLPFGLSKSGESAWLCDPDGKILDGTSFSAPPVPDSSLARYPDGTGAFAWCATPTFKQSNGTACASGVPSATGGSGGAAATGGSSSTGGHTAGSGGQAPGGGGGASAGGGSGASSPAAGSGGQAPGGAGGSSAAAGAAG
jgi:hypothetical protein